MTTDVFISYAHAGGAVEQVRALAKQLTTAGRGVFLDERTIPAGSPFPHQIADALMDATQVIVCIDDVYFTRPWCAYEMQVITAPFRAAATPTDDLLDFVTVVLPGAGDVTDLVAHLPPPLAKVSWPAVAQTDVITDLITSSSQRCTASLRERLGQVNDDAVKLLRRGGDVPLAWAPATETGPTTPPATRPWSFELAPESRAEDFIGREADLWRVFHHMVSGRAFSRVRNCGIQGPGGSGKSQLAAEFVARYGARFFPGGMVWVSASGDLASLIAQFRTALAAVAPGLDDLPDEATDADQQRAQLAQALVKHYKAWPYAGRMLWVVDDVPELAQGESSKPLAYWCPVLDNVNVLTTSRRTGVGNLDAYVSLGGLLLADAVDWLTRPEVDKRWLQADEWEDIVRWVGALPLAIAVLRTSLMDGYTTTQALQLAQAHEPAMMLDKEMAALRDEIDDERLRGVTEAFDFSYRLLDRDAALRHAAHLVACLAPYPLADHLLGDLVGTPLLGKLAKRSWLQRSAREGVDVSVRHYVMHRIPASFLRARMADPQVIFHELFGWLGRVTEGAAAAQNAKALGTHLMVIQREFMALVDSLPEDAPVVALARDFAVRSASAISGAQGRGFRFLAAELAQRLGAADEVAQRLTERYDAGDQEAAAAIPHVLQALPGSATAAALMARLLQDTRMQVNYQAIVHAGRLMHLDLATPLLEAIMQTTMEHPEPYFDVYLDAQCPMLRDLLSDLAGYLNEGTATQRKRAAGLLGRVLMRNGRDLQVGGWNSRSLVGGLLRVALEDAVPEVAEAALNGAASYFDAEAYHHLVEALSGDRNHAARARLLQVIGDYLQATRRPSAPTVLKQKFHDEGGVQFEIDLGQPSEALPAGVYEPLIRIACGDDERLGDIAAAGIMRTNEGRLALGDAAHQLLAEQANERVQLLATRVMAGEPEFINAHWWRGQARLQSGDAAGALTDFEYVLERTPEFADAYLWRGRAQETLGESQGAIDDYNRAVESDPEYLDALYFRALLRRDAGDSDGAIADLETLIAKTDDWQDAYYQHGVLLCQSQDFNGALPSLQRAAELAPDDFHAHHMVAFCLYNLAQHAAAEAAASRAIALNPDVAETWFFRGAARYAAGRATEALADLRQAMQLDPKDERVAQFKQQLEDYLEGRR